MITFKHHLALKRELGVERWFKKHDEESDGYVSCAMSENTDDFYAEFVFIKDRKIDKFVSNKDYQFE